MEDGLDKILDIELNLDNFEGLDEIKHFLFCENVRMEAEKKKLDELYEQFYQQKREFEKLEEKHEQKIEYETKKLENEKLLFEKKLQILQNAYQQLDLDRKAVEREKRAYHVNKKYETESNVIQYISIQSFFKGVDNVLALKKRYKDLIKIFHPDNICGDKDTVQMINKEYHVLKEKYQC